MPRQSRRSALLQLQNWTAILNPVNIVRSGQYFPIVWVIFMLRLLWVGLFAMACVQPSADVALAQVLEYDLKQDQRASYEYDIKVEMSNHTLSYTGVVSYTVSHVTDEFVRLEFQGGLNEQIKAKSAARVGSSNPSKLFSTPPGIPGVFGRYRFAGKYPSKNTLGLTRAGQVLTLDGTSQLPFLMGNLSLMPFEALPKGEQQSWDGNAGVSISDDSAEQHFLVRPFGPFAFQSTESHQTASETTSYTRGETIAGIVVVNKKYELKTPDTGDRAVFLMTGQGTWKFDTNDHLPFASDMQFSLSIREGNTTAVYPIHVTFAKLSAEQLATKEAEAQAARERGIKSMAERKVAAEAPLSATEVQEFVAELESGETHKQHSAMIKLMQKKLTDPDPAIVAAVRKLANSGEMFSSVAGRLLEQLDPVYRLNKQYTEGHGFLPSSDLPVDSRTELFVGQLVQAREHGSTWHAAEITELLSDKRVAVRYSGWGNLRSATLLRNQIQLAPIEVVQPHRAEQPAAMAQPTARANSSMRTWSDTSGSFAIEASFLGVSEDQVVLQRSDGRQISVPLNRLSIDDQRFVAATREELKKLGNPFEP